DTIRALAATVVLFGVTGFGLTRLCLPNALRRYEPLWVLPTGACAVGLAMTVLGFAYVPYLVSLVLVLAAGVALGVYAVRTRGWPELSVARHLWPAYVAVIVLAVALVPMIFHLRYAAPVGTGSDAHVAAGSANFLKHAYPTGVDITQPINQMPPTWKSKFPIYYAFAGVSSLSGLDTWQVLAPLAAALLGMAAIGMFLVARDVFSAPVAVSLVAMAIAALAREALHTVLNPYFNQTWGFFAMPFTLVLGWWVVQPGLGRGARRGTLLLLALFALILVFAYPLAAPIPALPIIAFVWIARRRRIAAGEHVFRLRNAYRGWRSLLWIVPVAALLVIPALGVYEKGKTAAHVLIPGHSLQPWDGDLGGYQPFNHFFSLPNVWIGTVLLIALLGLAAYALLRTDRALTWGLGGLSFLGLALGIYFRERAYGWYFEFKLLAFVGPLLLLMAAVGAGRLRRAAVPCLAALCGLSAGAVVAELDSTGYQLPKATIALSSWAHALPPSASIRLDMWPPNELWAAYFLASRPLCSQTPLLGTDYPHVPVSRKADYIIVTRDRKRPADAIGP